jgi:ceramide glucosyltransferase
VNPKINNMAPAYRAASYPLILVSDSSIKMREDTLTDMVLCMTDNVGLVHQMPCKESGSFILQPRVAPDICDGAGLSSSLEKVFFGTFHARMYLNSDLFGINCATGMSALMRKELLDNKGGFEAFGCYLAEDFFFAQAVQASETCNKCTGPITVLTLVASNYHLPCRSRTTSWQ